MGGGRDRKKGEKKRELGTIGGEKEKLLRRRARRDKTREKGRITID